MSRQAARIVVASALGLVVLSPSADGLQRPVGTATVSGAVVAADGASTAIGGAIVTLSGAGGEARNALTDEDGRFTFGDVPAGHYELAARKPPFLAMRYGASRPGRDGTLVSVARGEEATGLVIRLPAGGVITGTIRDSAGGAVADLPVTVVNAPQVTRDEDRTPAAWQAMTDDRGIYRIFGLPPGRYLVATRAIDSAGGLIEIPSSRELDRRFAALERRSVMPVAVREPDESTRSIGVQATYSTPPIFFPGTPAPAMAQPVIVAIGEEQIVDFAIGPVLAAFVEGVIRTADGSDPGTVAVELEQLGPALPSALTFRPRTLRRPTAGDGRFAFEGVTPGQYALTARSSGQRDGSAPFMWGSTMVTANGGDVAGLTVTLQPGLSIRGRARFEGEPAQGASTGVRIGLRLKPSGGTGRTPRNLRISAPDPAAIDAQGTFEIHDLVPGAYELTVLGTSRWWLRSAMVGDEDVLDHGLALRSTDAIVDMALTFIDRPASLEGSLHTPAGAPASGFHVVVFPAGRELWRPGTRRVVAVRPATDGRFRVEALPEGDYLVAALTDVQEGDLADPAFLATLASAAVTVALVDGQSSAIDLRISR